MTYNDAKTKLGDYAIHEQNGSDLAGRIGKLMAFAEENPDAEITIEESSNWSNPPRPASVKKSQLLGGTTYRYHVWAVIR